MAKRMLIDATHFEEKRVALINNNKLEEFDFETSTKQQIKGNIYLAKVVRVEPSLQAAFVDYGGNRQGFLAFSEIHPDYYRIPVADRDVTGDQDGDNEDSEDDGSALASSSFPAASEDIETVGGNDADEFVQPQRSPRRFPRGYKIQDVIKRRQIMLVQVVKEERNAKGAALTTYLSLAGRYCVLMPNAEREGGVSRKITSVTDRKRLKTIVEGLHIPETMGVIIRTAGMERSKAEIKRDCDYLLRLWDEIREKTLRSTAPCLIYQEADLIKRAIRDLYARDIGEILIEGEEGFKAAKNFMKTLMPSHVKKVVLYENKALPLFHEHNVESMIDAIHSPVVNLRSGGYIVINPTEALVSIDVNSGRATRERHIEETALKTNLEAAEEIALQLRLRDLAGLIVIDFIDMDDSKNISAVERRLKEAMANDRARIQIGRISPFGLLELSRQRLRPSIIEASTLSCPHCHGTGHIRSTESSTLHVLRAIEEEALQAANMTYSLKVPSAIALYLLNQKRGTLIALEKKYNLTVLVDTDDSLIAPQFQIDYPGKTTKSTKKKDVSAQESTSTAEGSKEKSRHHSRQRRENNQPLSETSGDIRTTESGSESDAQRRRRRRRRRRSQVQRPEAFSHESASLSTGASPTPDEPSRGDLMVGTENTAHEKEARRPQERQQRNNRRDGKSGRPRPSKEHAAPSHLAFSQESGSSVEHQEVPLAKETPQEGAGAVKSVQKKGSQGKNAQEKVTQEKSSQEKGRPKKPAKDTPSKEDAPKEPSAPRKRTRVKDTSATEKVPPSSAEDMSSSGARKRGWWKRLLN